MDLSQTIEKLERFTHAHREAGASEEPCFLCEALRHLREAETREAALLALATQWAGRMHAQFALGDREATLGETAPGIMADTEAVTLSRCATDLRRLVASQATRKSTDGADPANA